MTLDEVTARREALKEKLATIRERQTSLRTQLNEAIDRRNATGLWADPTWWRNSHIEVRKIDIEARAIETEIGRLGREIRRLQGECNAAADFNRLMATIAAVLPPETFQKVLQEYRAR